MSASRNARRRGSGHAARLLAAATLALVPLAAVVARDDAEPSEVVREGRFTYFLAGKQTGGEQYVLYRLPEGGTRLTVKAWFKTAGLRAEGALERDADGWPTRWEMKVTHPSRGETVFTAAFAREPESDVTRVTIERASGEGGTKKSAEVEVKGRFTVVEEGVLAFDEAALGPVTADGGEVSVLVPQLAAVHPMRAKPAELDARARAQGATRALEVSYRGAGSTYWFDDEGRLLRVAAKAAAGEAIIVREKD